MRKRHGWDTTLDLQTDLIQSFASVEGRRYLDGVADSMGRAGTFDSRTGETVERLDPEYPHLLVNAAAMTLRDCDPFYVNDELSVLIDYAAGHKSFKPEPLMLTDLIVPAGFAYFEEPLHIVDSHGVVLPYRAIQWTPVSDQRVHDSGMPVPVTFNVTHGTALAEPAVPMVVGSTANLTGILYAMYQHCDDPDPYVERDGHGVIGLIGGSRLTLSYVSVIKFEGTLTHLSQEQSIHDMFAHLKTFFRLCQQTIALPRFERVSRPTWKRAVKRWKPISEVVVFTLRRAKPPRYEGPEREVDWSHRWIVGGHWRNQYYPSEKVHRQIYIAPYIKGPDDKPIVFKRRAFELVR